MPASSETLFNLVLDKVLSIDIVESRVPIVGATIMVWISIPQAGT